MEVIVEEKVGKASSAVDTRLIGAGIGPFTSDGLDEAFSLAIGLRAIGFGKEMLDAELLTGGGKVVRAIGSATIGEHALDGKSMSFIELNCLMKRGHHALDLLIRQEAGKGKPAMIIYGNVQALDSSAAIALRAVSGGTHARTREAAQLLDVEVKQLTGSSTFVALHGRLGRFKRAEAVEAVAAQDARDCGLGDLKDGEDLCIGTTLATKSKDVGFELGAGPAGLTSRDRGTIRELGREAAFPCPIKPATNRPLADMIGGCNLAQGEVVKGEMSDHFSSHPGGKSGISVHVVRGVWRWVWCSSTTSLHDRHSADNVLKHDT